MAMYVGEVIVKNHAMFRWVVREFPFVPGTYEIGVERGTLAVMLTRLGDVHTRPNNKKRESIWREYRRWVSLTQIPAVGASRRSAPPLNLDVRRAHIESSSRI